MGESSGFDGSRIVFPGPFEVTVDRYRSDAGPAAGEVLIGVDCTLISPGTELALYTGSHVGIPDPENRFAKYPFSPGYSGVGRVLAIGPGVTDLEPGDKVFASCRHATHAVFDRAAVHRVREDSEDRATVFARMAEISLTSVLQAQAVLQSSSWVGIPVAVLGMGLVGNLAAQLFGLLGADVVGVDLVAERLEVARRSGVRHLVRAEEGRDLEPAVSELIGGGSPQVVVEATGSPALVNPALRLVAHRGQVILLGSTRGKVEVDVYKHIHSKGIFVAGAHEGLQGPHVPTRSAMVRYVLDLIERGALRVEPLLTHVLPAEQAKQGYELLIHQQQEALGVVLDWRS